MISLYKLVVLLGHYILVYPVLVRTLFSPALGLLKFQRVWLTPFVNLVLLIEIL
jgi:hypothetical protein